MQLRDKFKWYMENHGVMALVRRAFGIRPSAVSAVAEAGYFSATGAFPRGRLTTGAVHSAMAWLESIYPATQPLPIYSAPGPVARLNLVTDSINAGSLFGGVGTAILLAALLARQRGAKLRIVTRTQAADESGLAHVLECNGVEFDDNVEFSHIGVGDPDAHLDVCDGDRFLTTSWWTTACVLGSVRPDRVDYLLQEDERMFYAHGDDWLRCHELMSRTDIRYLINSELLFKHLLASGLEHLRERAHWFEPAFPLAMFHRAEARPAQSKRQLFFYARPNNLRNLFFRGIEVLDRAVAEGIIDPARWDVVFIGKDVPGIRLAGILEPRVLATMGWMEYAEFIRNTDLGFCLMATPHPSYPPLDLAASGAIVLTNRFGLKQDLSCYSENIVCSDLSLDALLEGLRRAIEMAQDDVARLRGYESSRLSRSWAQSLAPSIDFLV